MRPAQEKLDFVSKQNKTKKSLNTNHQRLSGALSVFVFLLFVAFGPRTQRLLTDVLDFLVKFTEFRKDVGDPNSAFRSVPHSADLQRQKFPQRNRPR
jgi:hypothetical protein